MAAKTDLQKEAKAKSGNVDWRPVKPFLEAASNRKCWYTESKNAGCLNDVEHFRPKGRVSKTGTVVHWYWFLAFNPINYRLSCQISNRLNVNSESGLTGGKGNKFPLLAGCNHAVNLAEIDDESPVLLDPCNRGDVELLEFLPDGRPVLSQTHAADMVARDRVGRSNLLLNLDFPTFNEDREQLYNRILKLVERGDRYHSSRNDALEDTKEDLINLMAKESEYSAAAECYIRCFRNHEWIEELFV